MTAALFSFLGIVIGASLQYIYTRHIEDRRHLRELRSKAYMDYLRYVAEFAQIAPNREPKEESELNFRIGDAKARICLYGSNEVISAFSTFQELGSRMGTIEQRAAFTNMVSAMRTDSGTELALNKQDIENVLLGIRE